MWMGEMTTRKATLSDDLIIKKARQLGRGLSIDDGFSYSHGWLERFKKRKGLKSRKFKGEARSANTAVVEDGRAALQELLSHYDPQDVYNMDETGLFYRLGSNQTLTTTKVRFLLFIQFNVQFH